MFYLPRPHSHKRGRPASCRSVLEISFSTESWGMSSLREDKRRHSYKIVHIHLCKCVCVSVRVCVCVCVCVCVACPCKTAFLFGFFPSLALAFSWLTFPFAIFVFIIFSCQQTVVFFPFSNAFSAHETFF